MTDVLVIGPDDYLILETSETGIPPDRFDDVRREVAEMFGIPIERIAIFTNLHVRVLRKEATAT